MTRGLAYLLCEAKCCESTEVNESRSACGPFAAPVNSLNILAFALLRLLPCARYKPKHARVGLCTREFLRGKSEGGRVRAAAIGIYRTQPHRDADTVGQPRDGDWAGGISRAQRGEAPFDTIKGPVLVICDGASIG